MAVSSACLLLAGCDAEIKEETSAGTLKTPQAKVSEVTMSGFRLDWEKVYGAGTYSYSLNGSEPTATDALFVTFSGLQAETEYVVELYAEPAEGSVMAASESIYVHVRTAGVGKLAKPVITIGSTYASKTIVSWSVIPGAGSYEYSVGDISATTTGNRISLSNLAKGKDYVFTVKAIPSDDSNIASEVAEAGFTTSLEDVPSLLIVPEEVLADAVVFDVYAAPDATYYYDVVSSSTLMKYDEDTIIERYRAAIIEYAKSKGISLRLAMASALKMGTNKIGVPSLASEMSYDIIVFGMDYDGNVTTGLYTKRVTTTATGWSSGPDYGGSEWFNQNFYLTNAYYGLSGYGWTNSVWCTWKGHDVQSVRYRLFPTSTFNAVFSDPYDKEAVKSFLRDTLYSYAVKAEYLSLLNSEGGYNSLTPVSAGVSYTMLSLATSASGEETLAVNSITTKTSSEEYTWFSIAALVNEKYGDPSNKLACVLKGVGIKSGKRFVVKTSDLAGVPESSYPALISEKGKGLDQSYIEYINGNGLALIVDVEPNTAYTVMATVENEAGDKLTRHSSVTTRAAATKAANACAATVFENLAVNAVASPVGMRLDGVESVPVLDNPFGAEDIWTVIHNANIL